MKVAVDAEAKRILGGAILGAGGDEAVHSMLDAMALDAPYTALKQTCTSTRPLRSLIPTLLG
jgi:pyruvate/2-oxoglutarate dehydrogenase complex dihydrolipoamide dehydrogenase (E3) component